MSRQVHFCNESLLFHLFVDMEQRTWQRTQYLRTQEPGSDLLVSSLRRPVIGTRHSPLNNVATVVTVTAWTRTGMQKRSVATVNFGRPPLPSSGAQDCAGRDARVVEVTRNVIPGGS